MTHISEETFGNQYALPWLRDEFPDATITEEKYVEEPEGFVDAWVDLSVVVLAVEIGNDQSVADEAKQAVEYAHHSPRAVPVVIVPELHIDHDAAAVWRDRGVVIRELPTTDI